MINAKLFQQMFCPSRRRGSFKISQIIFHDLKMDPDWKVITQTLRVIVILILNEPSLMQGPKLLLSLVFVIVSFVSPKCLQCLPYLSFAAIDFAEG